MFDSAPLLRVYIQRAIIPIGLKDLVSTFILNVGGPEIVLVRFARANLRRSGWVFDELTRKRTKNIYQGSQGGQGEKVSQVQLFVIYLH